MASDYRDVRVKLGVDGVNASIADVDRFIQALGRISQAAGSTTVPGVASSGPLGDAARRVDDRLQTAPSGQPFSAVQKSLANLVVASDKYRDALQNLARRTEAEANAGPDEAEAAAAALARAETAATAAYARLESAIGAEIKVREDIAWEAGRELREQRAASASLERQRARGLGQQLQREINTVPQAEIDRLTAATAPAPQPGDTPTAHRQREILAERKLLAEAAQWRLDDVARASREGTAGTQNQARARVAQARVARDAANRAVVAAEEELAKALTEDARLAEKAAAERRQRESNAVSQAEIDRMTAAPARQPGDTPTVYRQREILADRKLLAESAQLRLMGAINAALEGTAGTQDQARAKVAQAISARDAASRAVVAAEQKLAHALTDAAKVAAPAGRTTFRESFLTGFRGSRDTPFAEQFGQAAKFSVFYGGAYKALFMLTQTLQQTLQEGVEFQDAMTDLKIATGRPKEELKDLADRLSEIAVSTGAAPSQGVQVGARSLGLYGATGATAVEQERIAQISAQVVSRMAIGSGKQPVDLQADIAAIAQALNLGPEGQFTIADLDAYFTKQFGIQQGSTLRTVGESATVGMAAGFTPEELFAIASDLISRTGQTDSAVAGYLAQIFSRGGEGSLTSVAQRYGVDPTQELAQVVRELATVYKTAEPQRQAEIAAAFGRGKVQNAAIALLKDFDEVQKQVEAARAGAADGTADAQFTERMQNIGGVMAQVTGDLKDFASQLGESGLLDIFGAGLLVFDQLLESVNGVLRIFNELPRPIRDTIVGLGALALALRFAGGSQLIGGARTAFAVRSTGVARGLELAALGTNVNGASSALRAAPVAPGVGGVLARTGSALGPLVTGASGAALGLGALALAAGSLVSSLKHMQGAADHAVTEITSGDFSVTKMSAGQIRAQADAVGSQARANETATPGFLNAITFGAANNRNMAMAEVLRARERFLQSLADDIDDAASATGGSPTSGVFTQGLGAEGLKSGLADLEARGASAATQFQVLASALGSAAGAASAAKEAFNPNEFAGRSAQNLPGFALNFAGGVKLTGSDGAGVPPRDDYIRDFEVEFLKAIEGQRTQQLIEQGLSDLGVDSALDLSPATVQKLARTVAEPIAKDFFNALPKDLQSTDSMKAVQAAITSAVGQLLTQQASSDRETFGVGDTPMSSIEGVARIRQLVETSRASLGDLGDLDYAGKKRQIRSTIAALRRVSQQADLDPSGLALQAREIANARQELVQTQLDEIGQLRKVAIANARNRKSALAASQRGIRRSVNTIIRGGGSVEQLAAVLDGMSRGSINLAKSAIKDALKTARAALLAKQRLAEFANAALSTDIGGHHMGGLQSSTTVPQTTPEIDRLNQFLDSIASNVVPGTVDSETSGYNYGAGDGGSKDPKASAAQLRAARANAAAAARGGDIAAARAAIIGARADMADATKGTVEWYQALASLREAQRSLRTALLSYRQNLRLLRIDLTNPLQQARAEAAAAAAQLRSDLRSHQARDVIAADRVALRNAQANAEQTAFQQRLDAVTTADELGRISHRKYISYLEHEKERLERIKHRTYQQQQQLDQIDRLLKEANQSMAGQFNLGDIRLPTPYEVRRYMAGQAYRTEQASYHGNTGRPIAPRTTVNMHINGADTAKVKAIVREVVGAGARINTTATRRR